MLLVLLCEVSQVWPQKETERGKQSLLYSKVLETWKAEYSRVTLAPVLGKSEQRAVTDTKPLFKSLQEKQGKAEQTV